MKARAAIFALLSCACGGQGTETSGAGAPTASVTALPSASASGVALASATADVSASSGVPVASSSPLPSASASVSAPETLHGTVKIKSIVAAWAANGEKVGDRMLPGFRRCYSQALEKDPTASGDVRIQANIGANGEVISTKLMKGSKLSDDLQACMATRVKTAMFAPPPAAPGFVKVTIHCEP